MCIIEIQTEHSDIICGFCGQVSICYSNLVRTSRGKNKDYYEGRFKTSQNNPCTNRLFHCSVAECEQVVWPYNMEAHFNLKHEVSEIKITDDDVRLMAKIK